MIQTGLDSVSQGLENQGTAAADGLNPDTGVADPALATTDDSDNGTNPDTENGEDDMDGVFGNDPTPIIIADISAAKQVVGTPTLLSNGNFEATYQVVIENTGTVDLANLTLNEDLAAQFGAAYVDAYDLLLTTPPADPTSSVTLDTANFDGDGVDVDGITEIVNTAIPSLLAVGDSFIFTFKVEINAALATGVLENTVTAGGAAVDENGDPILASDGTTPITATDDSDSGTDPSDDNSDAPGDMETTDDPTPLLIPNIGLAKEASAAVPNGDNFDVTFTLNWENIGTVALDSVEIFDNILAQFGNQFVDASIDSVTTSGTANVVANTAWEGIAGDTTQSLIIHTGDDLAVGDTIQVVFTVTIDPDVSGTSSGGLENQATSTGTGVNPDTGLPDPTLMAMDTSDNGADPTGENSEDDIDGTFGNDPTPVIIPDIRVVKQVAGTPVLLANGNFGVTYELVVENTGNVDLADLTLVEDLSDEFGSAFQNAGNLTLVSSGPGSTIVIDSDWDGTTTGATEIINQTASTLLAVGESYTIQFTVEVDPDAVGAPATLDNQVTAGGAAVDENGDPIDGIVVSDDSDSGTDPNGTNPDEPGDNGTSDDPTPLLIPSIGIAKSAGVGIPNGDDFDVTFTLIIENNGNVDLTNLEVFDDIASEFGDAFVDVSNVNVQNFSGTGTTPFVNNDWASDTTQSIVSGGTLAAGDSFEIVFTVTIDTNQSDTSAPLENQATASGEAIDANGNPVTVTDDSDNGVDPSSENGEEVAADGVYANDPTPIQYADLGIAKQVVGEPTIGWRGFATYTFQLVVENTGTVDLIDLSLLENLQSQFGSVFVEAGNLSITNGPTDPASSVAINSAWDGGTVIELLASNSQLAVGDSFVLEFTSVVDVRTATDLLENQVTGSATGVDENGNPLINQNGTTVIANDVSDNGLDPSNENSEDDDDGIFGNDPTIINPEIDPAGFFYDSATGQILTGGSISVTGPNGVSSVNLVDNGADGSYQFFGTEAGTYVVTVTAPPGYQLDTSLLANGAFDPTGLGNPVLLGSDDADGNGLLDSTVGTTYFLEFDLEAMDPAIFLNNLPFTDTPLGTTGNPVNLPFIGGAGFAPRISNVGGVGFSQAIANLNGNGNSNSLSLDAPFSSGGGYISQFGLSENDACCESVSLPPDCECEPVIVEPGFEDSETGLGCEPCESIHVVPAATIPMGDAAAQPESIESGNDFATSNGQSDATSDDQSEESDSESDQVETAASETENNDKPKTKVATKQPTFLKKLQGWLVGQQQHNS